MIIVIKGIREAMTLPTAKLQGQLVISYGANTVSCGQCISSALLMDTSHRHLVILSLAALMCWAVVTQASADSAGDYDLPGPGLAFGGIPYGSVSGMVADYFNRRGGNSYNTYRPYKSLDSGRNYRYRPRANNRVNYDLYSRDFD